MFLRAGSFFSKICKDVLAKTLEGFSPYARETNEFTNIFLFYFTIFLTPDFIFENKFEKNGFFIINLLCSPNKKERLLIHNK